MIFINTEQLISPRADEAFSILNTSKLLAKQSCIGWHVQADFLIARPPRENLFLRFTSRCHGF